MPLGLQPDSVSFLVGGKAGIRVTRKNRFVFMSIRSCGIIFCVFGPEIACQAPKPPNSLQTINIQVEV